MNNSHEYQSNITQGGFANAEREFELLNFKKTFAGDFYTACWHFSADTSLIDIVDVFKAKIKEQSVIMYLTEYDAIIKNNKVIVCLTDSNCGDDPWKVTSRAMRFKVSGNREDVHTVLQHAQSYPKNKKPRISWNYLIGGGRHEADVFMDEPRNAPDSFYPYIRGGLKSYINEYAQSSASVLLLRGEPGTGKTSFIQNLIWQMNGDCMITYEDSLFQSDEMFVEFLTSTSKNLLIMEDADAMLLTREKHGNQTMAKFLNVSDGLIRFPNKKIIISSNIVDDDRIDPALMRPGRCFDAPMFRRLSYAETLAACEDARREPPKVHRDYSLAEILNGATKRRISNVFGFTAAG